MLGALAKRLFGTANDREIKKLDGTVVQINALEPELEKLSDADLRAQTDRFRERLGKGETVGPGDVASFVSPIAAFLGKR